MNDDSSFRVSKIKIVDVTKDNLNRKDLYNHIMKNIKPKEVRIDRINL